MMNTGIYHKSRLTRADMRNFVWCLLSVSPEKYDRLKKKKKTAYHKFSRIIFKKGIKNFFVALMTILERFQL